MSEPGRKLSRRERYARETQRAIIDAGRELFAQQGYFATRVDDIAARAEVAPATVYAVVGGKPGLVAELIKQWSEDPRIAATMSTVASSQDPREIVRTLGGAARAMRENWADVIWILLSTAPHDENVAELFRAPTELYRSSIAGVAGRLVEVGALREGIDADRAADILWLYFGYGSLLTLHDQCGWSYEAAELWLVEQASSALLN